MKKLVVFLVGAGCVCFGARHAAADRPLFYRAPDAVVCDPILAQLAAESDAEPLRAWVLFTDKGIGDLPEYRTSLDRTAANMNPRALARRAARRSDFGLCDHRDLPVNETYVRCVLETGARLRVRSKWVNGISVRATLEQLHRIAALDFVRQVTPVRRSASIRPLEPAPLFDGGYGESGSRDAAFYGSSWEQLEQINIPAVHDLGYTGEGILLGILDTGFKRNHVALNTPGHELQIVAEYDFVNQDDYTGPEPGDPFGQADHGTCILGTLAAYAPGDLVGSAHDAAYLLAKTEDTSQEVPAEEDYFVAGLEWLEANGADLVTSSLGYIAWYNQSDLDGQTAVTTIAVNAATANGLVCLSAAGNEYHDSNPDTSHLIAPSDALELLGCGAVDGAGNIADFSSDGPSADGRVKPELLARGVITSTISTFGTNGYTFANGTSLSTPLVAGATALVIQAHPDWTVRQVRGALLHTASDYVANGQPDPLFVRGYGIVDTLAAIEMEFVPGDIDADGDVDLNDFALFAACYTGADATSGSPPGCGAGDFAPSDLDGDGDVDLVDFATFAMNFTG